MFGNNSFFNAKISKNILFKMSKFKEITKEGNFCKRSHYGKGSKYKKLTKYISYNYVFNSVNYFLLLKLIFFFIKNIWHLSAKSIKVLWYLWE
jgi:hypothetical protein